MDSIESALADIKAGKIIIVVDDEDRENEGDFILASEAAIRSAVSRWVPQVSISSVEILDFSEDGYANIKVQVLLPNNQGITVTVNSSIFGSNGSVSRGE